MKDAIEFYYEKYMFPIVQDVKSLCKNVCPDYLCDKSIVIL